MCRCSRLPRHSKYICGVHTARRGQMHMPRSLKLNADRPRPPHLPPPRHHRRVAHSSTMHCRCAGARESAARCSGERVSFGTAYTPAAVGRKGATALIDDAHERAVATRALPREYRMEASLRGRPTVHQRSSPGSRAAASPSPSSARLRPRRSCTHATRPSTASTSPRVPCAPARRGG